MHIWGIPLLLVLLAQIPYRFYLLLKERETVILAPSKSKKMVTLFLFLSFMLPWAAKAIILIYILYM